MSAETPPTGIRTDELDEGVRPQDDLYLHVNGRWLDRTDIPDDKARWGSFHQLAEAAEEAVRVIIEEAVDAAPGSEERKFGDLFTSFMDEERVESLGVEPIRDQLDQAAAVTDVPTFLATLGRLEQTNVSGLLGLFVDNDPGDPERYVVQIEQGGIGLPDESYYREEGHAGIRTAYRAFVERMLGLAQLDDPAGRADRILDLETRIAAAHWDNVRTRDSQATYNLTTWAGLRDLVAKAAWADLDVWRDALEAPGGALDEVVLREPSFAEGLGALLTADEVPALRDWLTWQVVRSNAALLPKAFSEASFDFYGRTLTGAPEQRVRWKRGVSLVEGAMGEAIGRIYVDRHFSRTAKAEMDVLVGHLVEAYRDSISGLDWMTAETRGRALEKLDAFTPKIGFPDRWRDYSALEIDPTDLVGNVRATARFETRRELAKIGAPLDRDEWFMTPQTINAYYNPGFNEIVFPAAILQFPFFDEERDPAANYGAIGAVIGHEIGHGFDDQGSRYDGDGRLTDWWTPADRAAFEQRTASLIQQYDALVPAQLTADDAPHVNGALTIGENIGDLGGLSIAWKAYLLSLDGAEPPVIDGLTGAERFFLSWAQAWQQKGRDAEVTRLLAIDPHAPNEFRCNQIVRNIDAFYATFDVQPGDGLWLDEEARVTIW
ncbi:Neutral endopeptidase [Clavibacter michiganensis]|uniref:Neutral endopeptidase n=1 Tax=Clavibacter michiganensis TaxID=28447 RepID=A0A251XY26_9MICO|nr:Neutral endopeptidase [Clavibacter michiganensis]